LLWLFLFGAAFIATSKGMFAVKLCTHRILQFLTDNSDGG